MALLSLDGMNDKNLFVAPVLCGTKFYVFRHDDGEPFQALPDRHNATALNYPQAVLDGIGEELSGLFSDYCVPCYTEHRQGKARDIIFCGHPSYRGSVWHDWAYFTWEDNGGNTTHIPGKILFFCDLRNIQATESYEPGIYAVTHSMQSAPTLVHPSCLLRKGSLATNHLFEICDVETISKAAFVYRNPNEDNVYHVIPDRSSWSKVLFSADHSHDT